MTNPASPEARLWQTLDRVHNVLARRIQGRLAEHGLTVPQYRVLRRLQDGAPQGPQAFAAEMGVTPGNLTGVIDRLEEAGLVRRDRGGADRRCLVLHLTDAGRAKIEEAAPSVRAHVAALLAPLSPVDVADMQDALDRLEGHLSLAAVAEVLA